MILEGQQNSGTSITRNSILEILDNISHENSREQNQLEIAEQIHLDPDDIGSSQGCLLSLQAPDPERLSTQINTHFTNLKEARLPYSWERSFTIPGKILLLTEALLFIKTDTEPRKRQRNLIATALHIGFYQECNEVSNIFKSPITSRNLLLLSYWNFLRIRLGPHNKSSLHFDISDKIISTAIDARGLSDYDHNLINNALQIAIQTKFLNHRDDMLHSYSYFRINVERYSKNVQDIQVLGTFNKEFFCRYVLKGMQTQEIKANLKDYQIKRRIVFATIVFLDTLLMHTKEQKIWNRLREIVNMDVFQQTILSEEAKPAWEWFMSDNSSGYANRVNMIHRFIQENQEG